MNQGRTVFAQLISFLSHNEFNRCVARYGGNKSVRSFSCWDQFLTMAFAQLYLSRKLARHRGLPCRSAAQAIRPARHDGAGLAAQGFALLGTLVGVFTIFVGMGPRTVSDIAYHLPIVVVLVWGLIIAKKL